MSSDVATPRVAIACSGLGHVQRGIESWASDLATGLRAEGVDVTLFGGAPGDGIVALPCLRRTGTANRALLRIFRHLGGWRYAFGSAYEIEQTSFSLALWREIRRDFDILHAQDPAIALWAQRAHRLGLSRPRVLYANGTDEGPLVMRQFRYLQLLTRQAFDAWRPLAPTGQAVFMAPNFIDTARFRPADKAAARARFNLPRDTLIVLCCAAIRRYHKRVDYLLTEFAEALRQTGQDALLVVAGGREADTDEIIAEGTALLGDRVRFLPDVPRRDMPDLYRTADLFALASLHEMFGIVLLEAMATGLPVVCHDTPNFRSVAGPAGAYHDISGPGGLAAGLAALFDPGRRNALAAAAHPWVEQTYATPVVVREIKAIYAAMMDGPTHD